MKIKISKKILILFSSIFGTTLIALLIVAIIFGFKQTKVDLLEKKIEEVVTPTPEEVQEISNPSPYANDLIILKIEQDIKKIDKELQETDLKEASLNPPLLDMDIEFEIKD